MSETTNERPPLSTGVPVRSLGAGLCLATAGAVVALALISAATGPASAQQAGPPPGQAPADMKPPTTPDAEAKKAEEPPTPAEKLIDEARDKLAKLKSCSADIEQTVFMLNQRLTTKGKYLKAPGNRIYFLLSLANLPDSSGTALQVCDGETLWRYESILESQVYHKLSIKPVLERLNSPELDPRIRDEVEREMGFAGPETLLIGLRKYFRFDQDKVESKIGSTPVWVLHGSWKSRQGLMDRGNSPAPAIGLLPPYIPSLVTLYLGQQDGWPYKLELVGRKPTSVLDTRKVGPDGRKIGSLSSIQSVDPTNITLVYDNVKLNPALNPDDFVFQAPSAMSVEDGTEQIVKQLDQVLSIQADRKKAEGAKKDVPVLDQPIEIPTPPAQPPVGQPPR